jgi:hypothetical protein
MTKETLDQLRELAAREVTNHGLTRFEYQFLVEQRVQTMILSGRDSRLLLGTLEEFKL